MTRISILSRDKMDPEQGKVFDEVKSEGGPLGGPYWAYIRFPKMMRSLQDLSNIIGAEGGLTKRERQLAIMAVIRFWGAEYPWSVQERSARALGIDAEILEAINVGLQPNLSDTREKIAYSLAHELLSTKRLSEGTYKHANELFDEKALVTLVATVGQFSMTCLTTIAYDCTPGSETTYRLKSSA